DERKGKNMADEDGYINFFVYFKPLYTLLEGKIESYKKRGLSKFEIEAEIADKQKELIDLWHKDDLDFQETFLKNELYT
ncbi:hypothetical protein PENTCL1PPCAC_5734, partial [Pristionchus entomophagus]